MAVGAADVEERAVTVYRGENEAAGLFPFSGRARRARLAARISRCQVGGSNDRADPPVPFAGIDFTALVGSVDLVEELPTASDRALLQRRTRLALLRQVGCHVDADSHGGRTR